MSLRTLGRVCLALFALSTAFPTVAGVLNAQRPALWLGIADMSVAALLVGVAALLATRGRQAVADRHRLAAFRTSQAIAGLIPALLAAYFVVGSRVNWTVIVVGLAWRAWLLLYTLPVLAAALASERRPSAA